MDAGAKEDVEAKEDAVVVAASADVPDARDTPHGDSHGDKYGDTCGDKQSDDNNDEDDGYDDTLWSHVDDVVVGPEYRRQITNTAKWK